MSSKNNTKSGVAKHAHFFLPGLLKSFFCHSYFRGWKVSILISWQRYFRGWKVSILISWQRTSKTETAAVQFSSETSVFWTMYRSSSSKIMSFPGTFNTVELKHHFKISGMDSSTASERGSHSVGVVPKEYSNLSHRRLPPGHSIPWGPQEKWFFGWWAKNAFCMNEVEILSQT